MAAGFWSYPKVEASMGNTRTVERAGVREKADTEEKESVTSNHTVEMESVSGSYHQVQLTYYYQVLLTHLPPGPVYLLTTGSSFEG